MASSIDSLPPELLELALWFLPAKDLIHAQRVCRLWQKAISGSTKLQIALFRAPQPVEWVLRCTNAHRPRATPQQKETWQLVKATPRDKQKLREKRVPRGHNRDDGEDLPRKFVEHRFPVGTINDILFENETPDNVWKRCGEDFGAEECVEIGLSGRFLEAMRSTDTSWRSMYISQPPTKRLLAYFDFRVTGTGRTRSGREFRASGKRHRHHTRHATSFDMDGYITSNNGVTAGQVADKIERLQNESSAELQYAAMWVLDFSYISQGGEKQLREQDDSPDEGEDFNNEDHYECISY